MSTTRRMLARNITVSKKVARLTDPWAKLFYTWLIPFTDDFGRFHAEPELLKAAIFPREAITLEQIEKLSTDLSREGLITLYEVDDSAYLELVAFDKFQTFRGDRKRQAEYPEPGRACSPDPGKPLTPKGKPMTPLKEDKESKKKESEGKRKKLAMEVDVDRVKGQWNSIEWLAGITTLSDTRKKKLRERDYEMVKEGIAWTDLFTAIEEQKPFLSGENEKGWVMTFDWLIANDTNWVKVIERKYLDQKKRPARGEPPQPGMIYDEEKKLWRFPTT